MASDAERAKARLISRLVEQWDTDEELVGPNAGIDKLVEMLKPLLAQVRLETLREAQLAFKAAYSEQENPLLGTMYGLKAIAELEQASGTGK